MKTISIRDLRQHWPKVEASLEVEQEILITRGSKPVAKLVRVVPEKPTRMPWDPQAHMKWLKKVWGNKVFPSSDDALSRARADR